MAEHVILVAFQVEAETSEGAQQDLMRWLPKPGDPDRDGLSCWWIAEDDRIDGSDNDSAIFVPKGCQETTRVETFDGI